METLKVKYKGIFKIIIVIWMLFSFGDYLVFLSKNGYYLELYNKIIARMNSGLR